VILDDKDEFETGWGPNFFWGLQGTGKTCDWNIVENLYGPNLKERVPKLYEHQRAFLASIGVGRLPEPVHEKGRARKGEPKPRKTPLLCNTPRTTPETAKYLPNRQHSVPVGLDDKDEFGPPRDTISSFLSNYARFSLGDEL
jgi:hypothetical protein